MDAQDIAYLHEQLDDSVLSPALIMKIEALIADLQAARCEASLAKAGIKLAQGRADAATRELKRVDELKAANESKQRTIESLNRTVDRQHEEMLRVREEIKCPRAFSLQARIAQLLGYEREATRFEWLKSNPYRFADVWHRTSIDPTERVRIVSCDHRSTWVWDPKRTTYDCAFCRAEVKRR